MPKSNLRDSFQSHIWSGEYEPPWYLGTSGLEADSVSKLCYKASQKLQHEAFGRAEPEDGRFFQPSGKKIRNTPMLPHECCLLH